MTQKVYKAKNLRKHMRGRKLLFNALLLVVILSINPLISAVSEGGSCGYAGLVCDDGLSCDFFQCTEESQFGTCYENGGYSCRNDETCDGGWYFPNDLDRCCSVPCDSPDSSTCADIGLNPIRNCALGSRGCASGDSVHVCMYQSFIGKNCYEVIEECGVDEKCVDSECVLDNECADLNDFCLQDSDCCSSDSVGQIGCDNFRCSWDDVGYTCTGQGGVVLAENWVCDGDEVSHDNEPYVCCIGETRYVDPDGGVKPEECYIGFKIPFGDYQCVITEETKTYFVWGFWIVVALIILKILSPFVRLIAGR